MCARVLRVPQIVKRVGLPIPGSLPITPDSVPIPYFGDYDNAVACTISINPSNKEFVNSLTHPPHPVLRTTLGASKGTLSSVNVTKVINFCDTYFTPTIAHKPYYRWFDPFEIFLNEFNLSYGGYHFPYGHSGGVGVNNETGFRASDGDVCAHLDMVQWATSPNWRNISKPIQDSLLKAGIPILDTLLQLKSPGYKGNDAISPSFKRIFLNGRRVIDAMKSRFPAMEYKEESLGTGLKIVQGKIYGIKVVGWNLYLQSASFPTYNDIITLARTVAPYV